MDQYVRLAIFFFQAEDGIRDKLVTGVQTCALPIFEPTADVVSGRFDLSSTGRRRFQRAWRRRQPNRVRKRRYREKRRFVAPTRRVGRRGAFAIGRSRSRAGTAGLGAKSRPCVAKGGFKG